MFFLQYRWKFHVLNARPCLDIFWNSPFSGVQAKILPKSSLKMSVSAGTKTFENLKLENFKTGELVVITTAQLHSTKPELRCCAGSNPACGLLEIHDGEDL